MGWRIRYSVVRSVSITSLLSIVNYVVESHCKITENSTTAPNPNAWSENYNLVALDHVCTLSLYSYVCSNIFSNDSLLA